MFGLRAAAATASLASLLVVSCGAPSAQAVDAEARIDSLLSRMTLTEKIGLLGGTGFETRELPRLGIPALTMTDGPLGVRYDKATAFPASIAMAATWDPDLIGRVGGAIAREARARGRRMLLGPCVNINRVPLGGRNFESFGEDPWLASRMAVAYVRGVQAEKVAATVKHFAANNQEWERNEIDARIDERALREIYLPAFRAAVEEGGAWAVMSAYNKLNGAWCSENPQLLDELLKSEWGFKGLVVSDWGAVHSTVSTANAGLDVEMPTGIYLNERDLSAAVARGDVREAVIDDKVRRLLRVLTWTGLLDEPAAKEPDGDDGVEHEALAREVARRGIVLLKNERSVLPLDRARVRSIAVIGPNAAVARTGGGGSSSVTPRHAVSALEGVTKAAGPWVGVAYAPGVTMEGEVAPIEAAAFGGGSTATALGGLQGEYFATMDLAGAPALVRRDPQVDFDWGGGSPGAGLPEDRFSVRWTGTLVPPASGAYELSVRSDDGARLWLDGRLLIDDWSDHGARAVFAPSRMQAGRSYRVVLEYYENGGGATVRLGWRRPDDGDVARAVEAARVADAAVVFAGTSADIESEGFDRKSLDLPAGQAELIAAVAGANPNTIVVVLSGAPIAVTGWIDAVPAVVQAWFPGQEGGTAIGEVLFGDVNPSGKLPVTFPKLWEDSPAFATYPGRNLATDYAEGVFVGYRHFDRAAIEPAFPFGHGLSYTTFAYADLDVKVRERGGARSVRVRFKVTNSGTRRGAEVAQVYVHDVEAGVPRPPRELKMFSRVELAPGETRLVSVELDDAAFSYYDVAARAWRLEPGDFEIQVGSSSRTILLAQRLARP